MRVFKKKPKGPSIGRAEALDRIPVKNRQISENRLETGEIVIRYPVTIRSFFSGLAKRFGGQEVQTQLKKIELDELGTSVWNLMDGNRSVRQVVKMFAEMHQLDTREAEVSVTQFLRELGRRGLIGMR
jgi:hypothetical protein